MAETKKTLKERAQTAGLRKAISYMDKNPDENIPKLIGWVEKTGKMKGQLEAVKAVISDKDSMWYKYVKSLWTDVDDGVRKTIFENVIINSTMIGGARQQKVMEEHGCNVPWTILMDPTSACNLHCTGCWAAEYGNRLNMSLEELDDIIEQATKMGTFMFLYSGGEPLVRKKDIIKLCEMHPDCMFLSFTNGTLIDEEFANEMLRVKNFIPAISIEGDEAATDARRGKGTYQAVIKAMNILKAKKLPFGISCCYTRANVESIGSEEFFDQMIDMGAKFAWLFTYIPVGAGAVTDLITTPEQREFMYHTVRSFRKTKPIFTMDFWNDGEYVNGCVAGGREYLHINANGDIEPCAFIHYSDSNIREKTLLEAFKSPLFMAYHDGQPFNDNMLRPCPLLDNPERLRDMVHSTGAHSTDVASPEDVDSLTAKTEDAAKAWAPVADSLWRCSGACSKCTSAKQGEYMKLSREKTGKRAG